MMIRRQSLHKRNEKVDIIEQQIRDLTQYHTIRGVYFCSMTFMYHTNVHHRERLFDIIKEIVKAKSWTDSFK